jgi:hypothetical protein|tara:strand:+ start:208 stop:672 length:465 start_codon:yes stop_codon:yes gene_type:complete
MPVDTQWDISNIENSTEVCYKTRSADGVFVKDADGNHVMRQRTLMIIDATESVYMNKITKKNCKEFYRRLKILQIVGFSPIENLRLPDIEEHIGLTTSAKTLTYKAFKTMVYKAMEDGADMIIKAEADGTMPQAEILDSQEDENDKDTEVEGND